MEKKRIRGQGPTLSSIAFGEYTPELIYEEKEKPKYNTVPCKRMRVRNKLTGIKLEMRREYARNKHL